MAAFNNFKYVKCAELPEPKDATAPLLSRLSNYGGREFELNACEPDEMPARGTARDQREFDDCVQAGHIFFHSESRKPPIPPTQALRAFIAAHPDLPIVVESGRAVEVPHLVLARFITRGPNEIAVDEEGQAIILLFTVAADNCGRAFAPDSHLKNGQQHDGVRILNWNTVNFNADVGGSPRVAWLKLYHQLMEL